MSSSLFEERHFYNRSYINVNTTNAPDTFSPFPYSNYSTIPKYSSRLDDYASRFNTSSALLPHSKLSPGLASDDGYNSSSASSTFMSFNPRRERSADDFSPKPRNPLKSEENGGWRDVEILRKDLDHRNGTSPRDGLTPNYRASQNEGPTPTVYGSPVPKPANHESNGSKVNFATDFTTSSASPHSQASPKTILKKPKINIIDENNVEVDKKPQKNVKHSIAEVEEREKLERQKAHDALMLEIADRPVTV